MSEVPFPELLKVEPRGTDRLHLTYRDGTVGEVSVAHLIEGAGVFSVLQDEASFRNVQVGSRGQVCWTEELELCPEALYLELTGKTLDEVIGGQQNLSASA